MELYLVKQPEELTVETPNLHLLRGLIICLEWVLEAELAKHFVIYQQFMTCPHQRRTDDKR